jgi:hypothetical protein
VNISLPANQTKTAIRAELVGTNRCYCPAAGLCVCAETPILEMCRQLVKAGYSPDLRLGCYRGATRALTVRGIGEAATLKINSKGTGFERVSAVRMSPLVRQNTSALPLAPLPSNREFPRTDCPPPRPP